MHVSPMRPPLGAWLAFLTLAWYVPGSLTFAERGAAGLQAVCRLPDPEVDQAVVCVEAPVHDHVDPKRQALVMARLGTNRFHADDLGGPGSLIVKAAILDPVVAP